MDLIGKRVKRASIAYDEKEVRETPGFNYIGKAYWDGYEIVVVQQEQDRGDIKWDMFKT